MATLPQSIIVEIAYKRAISFREIFYLVFDSSRDSTAAFFRANSKLVWDGNIVEGVDNINHFLKQLPLTEHTILTLNAHPILDVPSATQSDLRPLVVTCAGNLAIGVQKSAIGFVHTFVLHPDPASGPADPVYFILSAIMRTHDSSLSVDTQVGAPQTF